LFININSVVELRYEQRFSSSSVMLWATIIDWEFQMLRKIMTALFAVATLAILSPTGASARGGFGGGGFHGGGFHGGFGGGGWRGGGWRGPAFGALGLGVGLGLAGAGYGYPYGYGYPASYAYYGDGGCYLVRRRIWTSYGWRLQPVRVCNY
jgi:hypothetical protein